MTDPRIEAALLPLLQTAKPYEERFGAVSFGHSRDSLLHPPRQKRKRESSLPTINTSDYREMALYFMDFLFRHFAALESVEWETELEYDDSTGYANDPYHITINEQIRINYPSCFKLNYRDPESAAVARLAAIEVEGLNPESDFAVGWTNMSDEEQLAWYEEVEKQKGGYNLYYEERRQAATSAYLAANNLNDAVYTVAGMLCMLAELCHSRHFWDIYNESGTDSDVLAAHLPSAVKATRQGLHFTTRKW